MQKRLSKTISKFLFVLVILTNTSVSYCETAENFPFHITKPVEKEMTYDYSFEDVWETVLAVIEDLNDREKTKMKDAGIEPFKTNIMVDKNSGLITYTTSHKGKKDYLTAGVLPAFSYRNFLIEALNNRVTRIYFHETNYVSYNDKLFTDNAFAPHLAFAFSGNDILEEIQNKLKGKINEHR